MQLEVLECQATLPNLLNLPTDVRSSACFHDLLLSYDTQQYLIRSILDSRFT